MTLLGRAARRAVSFRTPGHSLPGHWRVGQVLLALMIAVLPALPVGQAQAQSGSCTTPANAIVAENCQTGNPASEWDVAGAGDESIQGFATDISVNKGQTVTFKVKTDAPDYRLDIYRLGYYGGQGARKITTIQPSASLPQSQPSCLSDAATGLIDCGNWSASASWPVPADAVSGIYIARPVREDGPNAGKASHIVFIVRDDAGQSDLLFQTSDTTWQAYNSYGGNSLYTGAPVGRAYKVSYNRPFNTRASLGGPRESWLFNSEYPMVRWLERNGYSVSYTTGVDTDRRGDELVEHKIFLSVGHDEYWSGQQRVNIEAARAAGVDLAFFSGNEVFWKTRWENSIDGSGTQYRTLVSYKETHANAKIDPSAAWTGTWRDPRFSPPSDGGKPENALTGTLFMVNGIRNDAMTVPADDGKMRFWRNTAVASLGVGQQATMPTGTLGYEWDEDRDNGSRPPGLIRLSTTTLAIDGQYLLDHGSSYGAATANHALTLYRHSSGALVFGAGTVQWSWGLDGTHDRGPSTEDPSMQQATVNLFADMGAQPGSLQAGLTAATASTDPTAPSAAVTSPSNGGSVQTGDAVTISGTATDAGGGRVGGVEVSLDNGTTWRRANGRESWTYAWTPGAPGSVTIKSRATDDSGNIGNASAGVTVNIVPQTCPCSLWNDTTTPAIASQSDSQSVELGVKIRSDQAGYITGIRFYKGPANTGTHVGKLWSSTGTNLATATFANETASGWQQVSFATPVQVTANTTYVASYHAPNGGYALNQNFFTTSGVDALPLHALANGVDGPNGVYLYGSGGFPTQSYQGSNYWVDVLFSTTPPAPDTTAPVISSVQATNIGTSGATITWTTSEAADSQVEYGTTASYGSQTTLDASMVTGHSVAVSGLNPGTPYHYRVKSKDAAGNLATSGDFTFTTAGPSNCPCTIWPSSATPAIASESDTSAFELGVKFRSDVGGYISGIRFYKGPGNTGTHVGNLWSSTGTNLAAATFTGETASGWQQVSFATPVQVTANTTYVASYHAPNGGFSKNDGYFATNGFDGAPLHALSSPASGGNGVYKFGASGFPTQTYNATNYWVDVVFTTTAPPPDSTPPVISAVQAADVSSNGATITWTTNEAADSQVEYGTTTSYGSQTTLDASMVTGHSVVIGGLNTNTLYHYRVKSKDAAGNLATSGDFTFTTTGAATCPCTIWPNTTTPAIASDADTSPFELGVKFRSDADGYITGLRFYKGPGNTGTHVGNLWSSTGTNLATVTFTGETATGWQQVNLPGPVQVTANTTYVASYHAPNGGFAKNEGYFASAGFDRAPLHALASPVAGGNGVFKTGASGFPTQTYNASNYWVDVVFTTTAPADTIAPVISAVQSADVSSNGATVTWTTNEAADSQVEHGTTTSYGSSTTLDNTDVLSHSVAVSGLTPNTLYHYRVKSKDAAGNLATSGDFTFTTSAAQTCPCTIWPSSATPAIQSESDTSPFELGVKFRTDADGYIYGIRFFKGSGNTGTHVANLWSSAGTNLATATFTGETANGWQQVSFAAPVQVTANTTYVASYHAPNGGFAKNEGYFASAGFDRAPLHALASPVAGGNGVFKTGASGFPTQTYNASNYWVDVVFSTTPPDTTGPTISAVQATSISTTGATITWTTNEAADTQVEYGLTTSYGSSTTLNTTMATSHSQALSGLNPSTLYHYRVKSRDAAGNLATSGDFTFTTASTLRSLDLNGTNGYAEIAHDNSLDIGSDWTIEMWFKDESSNGYNHGRTMLLTKGEVPTSGLGDSQAPFFIWIQDNQLVAGERVLFQNGTVSFNLVNGNVSANTWHHLAVTMRSSDNQLTIYIDGAQRAQGVLGVDSSNGNSEPIRIGRNGGGSGNYWDGKVDDVRIWNVVRTASEIGANDQTELSSAPAGLVANWKLNEGTGTSAVDSAGTAQNATLSAGASWSTEVHL